MSFGYLCGYEEHFISEPSESRKADISRTKDSCFGFTNQKMKYILLFRRRSALAFDFLSAIAKDSMDHG